MKNEHLKKGALVFQGFLSLFPAYAGVIPGRRRTMPAKKPFPRIRGGDPQVNLTSQTPVIFSPHTRG